VLQPDAAAGQVADGRDKNPITVGVRSFMHQFDNLEARCDQTLNLIWSRISMAGTSGTRPTGRRRCCPSFAPSLSPAHLRDQAGEEDR
jgi:hypothetical protein